MPSDPRVSFVLTFVWHPAPFQSPFIMLLREEGRGERGRERERGRKRRRRERRGTRGDGIKDEKQRRTAPF